MDGCIAAKLCDGTADNRHTRPLQGSHCKSKASLETGWFDFRSVGLFVFSFGRHVDFLNHHIQIIHIFCFLLTSAKLKDYFPLIATLILLQCLTHQIMLRWGWGRGGWLMPLLQVFSDQQQNT